MAENISKYDVLSSFGFQSNPFGGEPDETGDLLRVRRTLNMAIRDRGLIGIVGERGIGKSVAVIQSLERLNAKIVKVWAVDKKRVTIGDVEYALIRELSDEAPRRHRELRAVQLRGVLGQAVRARPVVLVIEEVHRVHGNTLRAIKALRELAWMGDRNLFTCVLIGQSDALDKPGMSEVRLRSDTIHMAGMKQDEARRYLSDRLGEVIADEARAALAERPEARNYLDLQAAVIRAMAAAMLAGRQRVEREDVAPAKAEAPKRQIPKKSTGLSAVLERRKAEEAENRKEAV